ESHPSFPRVVPGYPAPDARLDLPAGFGLLRLGGTARRMVGRRILCNVRERNGAVDVDRVPDASVRVPPDAARPTRRPLRLPDPRCSPCVPRGSTPLAHAA